MSELSIQFARPWSIRTPVLTRYMEKKYVEEFFEHGKMRISSFRSFRKNPDEERGDIFEGRVSAQIKTPNGNHAVIAMNGQEAYVMCTTTVESQKLEASFSTTSGFRILNTIGFANCISSHIPGFVAGLEGLCSYRDETAIRKELESDFPPPDSFPNPENWAKEYDNFVAQQTREGFFIKKLKYSHQAEYRFIWFAQGQEKEYIDIICPDARRFCQQFDSAISF